MTGSTITTLVNHTVVLDAGGYSSPLLVTATGTIAPRAAGSIALIVNPAVQGGTITNQGSIVGGLGQTSQTGNGGGGGIGVDMLGQADFTNFGYVAAGSGGNGMARDANGGVGGVAIYLREGAVINAGTIAGGKGGLAGNEGVSGGGGNAVDIAGAGSLTNSATILGGAATLSANGGIGVDLTAGGFLSTSGSVTGGEGGPGARYYFAGTGGAGVAVGAGSIAENSGIISGGVGGTAFYGGNSGGDGADIFAAGTLTNTGTIEGGAGGYGYRGGGAAGVGVDVAGGLLTNAGTIMGNTSGDNNGRQYTVGSAGIQIDGGIVVNTRLVMGGDGLFGAGTGVYLSSGTLITSGTISSGNPGQAGNDAVQAGYGDGATVIIEPGAVFDGLVAGNPGSADVLALGGTTTGTLTGLGSEFIGFTVFDELAGADWTLTGANTLGAGVSALTNGTFSVAGTLLDAGSLRVSGTASVLSGAVLQVEALTVNGTFAASSAATIVVGNTLAGARPGVLLIQNTGAVEGGDRTLIGSAIVDDGSITSNGYLTIDEPVSGSGSIVLDTSSRIYAADALSVPSIDFASGGNEELVLNAPKSVTGTFAGFSSGDTIVLTDLVATTLSFQAGTLTLDDGKRPVGHLLFAGNYVTSDFTLLPLGSGGTELTYAAEDAWVRGKDFLGAAFTGAGAGASPGSLDWGSRELPVPAAWRVGEDTLSNPVWHEALAKLR